MGERMFLTRGMVREGGFVSGFDFGFSSDLELVRDLVLEAVELFLLGEDDGLRIWGLFSFLLTLATTVARAFFADAGTAILRFLVTASRESSRACWNLRFPPTVRGLSASLISLGLGPRKPRQERAPQRHSWRFLTE